ncbi:hypothetical protein BAUCODRAFT_157121 [Baudoinia panamericana UAMH 10762]|uniref:Uncharacterized protein n=1 Tax=Baudoinia panamericana (strain UAMH 10762) TaxID=717646 RepID=M2MVY0_BAUPA|nr:uncharacterized protein BAUCODRAFT_157121 [Baudoinia panamericana UAMH 10762]EMC95713.1 hypothetical protein BAUCODRAFT_157121 [Baudoinia panamericana UAMH 10762]
MSGNTPANATQLANVGAARMRNQPPTVRAEDLPTLASTTTSVHPSDVGKAASVDAAMLKLARVWKGFIDADAEQHAAVVMALGTKWFGDPVWGEALTAMVGGFAGQ